MRVNVNELSVLCWNVNGGLNVKLGCPDFVTLCESYDIILLSETWTNIYSDLSVRGYECVVKHRDRKRKAKRDSGGLVCFFRESIFKGVTREPWDFEDGMCFKLNKNYFGWEDDLFILFVYMKPKQSTRQDIDSDSDCFEALTEQVAFLKGRGQLVLAGDFNARTGTRVDCKIVDGNTNQEFDFILDGDTDMTSGKFCKGDFVVNKDIVEIRHNEDKTVNEYGVRLLDLCHASDLIIINGRAVNDRTGAYTSLSAIEKARVILTMFCVIDMPLIILVILVFQILMNSQTMPFFHLLFLQTVPRPRRQIIPIVK